MRLIPRLTRPDLEHIALAFVSIADALLTILTLGFVATDWRAAFLFRND